MEIFAQSELAWFVTAQLILLKKVLSCACSPQSGLLPKEELTHLIPDEHNS